MFFLFLINFVTLNFFMNACQLSLFLLYFLLKYLFRQFFCHFLQKNIQLINLHKLIQFLFIKFFKFTLNLSNNNYFVTNSRYFLPK
jgi:hypothetical protein